MVTERLQVVVTEKGTRTVRRQIASLGESATTASSGVDLLKTALGGIGAAFVIRRLVQSADALTQIGNRLGLVTAGQAQLEAVTRGLFQVANDTRSSFEGTAEVYARTALAARNLGISQQETLNFTKSLNQAIILSGATAQEARSGLIQFSQGLASNRLAGDELRATLEQLPLLSDVIAKQFGVTRGELRELAAQGKVTADEILEAFGPETQAKIQEAFENTIPTIAQSFTVLENAVLEFIGTTNSFINVFEILGRVTILVADNFEFFANAVIFGAAVPAFFALTAAVNTLTAAIAANPIGLLVVGGALAIASIIGIAKSVIDATREIESLDDTVSASFLGTGQEQLARRARLVGRALDELQVRGDRAALTQEQQRVLVGLEKVEKSLERQNIRLTDSEKATVRAQLQRIETAKRARRVLKELEGAQGELRESVLDLNAAFREGFIGADELVRRVTELTSGVKDVERLTDEIDRLSSTAGLDDVSRNARDILDDALARAESRGAELSQARRDQLASLSEEVALLQARNDVVEELNGPANELANRVIAVQQAFNEGAISLQQFNNEINNAGVLGFVNNLEREVELLRLSNTERERVVALEEAKNVAASFQQTIPDLEGRVNALVRERQALQELQSVTESLIPPTINFSDVEEELRRRFESGAISVDQFIEALKNLRALQSGEESTDFFAGVSAGLDRIGDKISDVSGQVENTLVNAFNGAEDALVKFVQTGEVNFSKLVDSILADLTRLLARQALLGLFNAFTEGAGGFFNAAANAAAGARQSGGPVTAGQPFVVGERGPELFIPNRGGQVLSNRDSADAIAGASGPVSVNLNIQIDSEGRATIQESDENTQVILNVIRNNPDTIRAST